MKIKIKVLLMGLMISAAAFSAATAYGSVKNASLPRLPEEISRQFAIESESADYFLKNDRGYITIYKDKHFKKPIESTDIETACLTSADKAMLEAGIPVRNKTQLLMLLEDFR